MIDKTPARTIARSFRLLLLCATFCMVCIVMAQVASLRLIGNGNKAHVIAFEPAKLLSASFDHEMLNARLSFNSFVSTQKPDSLAAGWEHFHLAESRLQDLNKLIGQYRQLDYLRPYADRLSKDLSAYGTTLTDTVNMMQGGESKGPHFDARMQLWATSTAATEKDTDDLETVTFRLSEANTNGIAQWISDSQMSGWLLLSISFFIYYLLTRILRRRLILGFNNEPAEGLSVMEPVRVSTSPAANYGTR